MTEHPILFSGEMIRAILDGRKAQTRRVLKCPHEIVGIGTQDDWNSGRADDRMRRFEDWGPQRGYHLFNIDSGSTIAMQCPHGRPGDCLWVREAWRTTGDGGRCNDAPPRDLQAHKIWYEADGEAPASELVGKYRPPMFMPRWASRITLEITGVRVERLQEISDMDAFAEGIQTAVDHGLKSDGTARGTFAALWNSINAARGYGWDVNPWVWVIEFRRNT